MPASLITSRHKWVSLKVDLDIDEAKRPAFRVRPLTLREREDINAAIDAADGAEGSRAAVDLIGSQFVTGWKNLSVDDPAIIKSLGKAVGVDGAIAFGTSDRSDVLNAILSPEEAVELALLVRSAYSMKDDDRGNLPSPAQ